MAQTLEHNTFIHSANPITLPTCDVDTTVIQQLDDEPNDVGGLTAQELKAKFDKVGDDLKDYLNDELIPEIIAEEATEEARQQAEAERVANEIERVANETARNVFEAYDNAKTYKVNNKVAYQGSSYVCILQSVGHLPTDTTYWLLIAEKGVTLTSSEVKYADSTSGTVIPSTWVDSVPSIEKGHYLWTRTVSTYNNGTTTTAYSVAYQGTDGTNGTDGEDGEDGVSPTLSSSKVGKTTTITFTDAQHPTPTTLATILDGQDGQGSGDMLKSTYDSDSTVENAGGIKTYVQGHHDSQKQDATDNTLTTTAKTVVGAINELDAECSSLSTQKQDIIVYSTLSLPTASWVGSASPYSQVVSVTGATANSKIDLQMDSTAIAQMVADGCNAIYVANDNGTLTAYALGSKPTVDLSVQVTKTEVAV